MAVRLMDVITLLSVLDGIDAGGKAVMATVVRVRGHAYRKEGAAMLFLPCGKRWGSVSGGCIEADLEVRTADVAATGGHVCVTYNMRSEEDPIWGETLGCGGEISVLLEPVQGRLRHLLRLIGVCVDRGGEAILIREWDDDAIEYSVSYGGGSDRAEENGVANASQGLAAGGTGATRTDIAMHAGMGESEGATSASRAADKRLQPLAVNGVTAGGRRFELRCRPLPRLVLFGDGEDARAVARLARGIGFRPIIADWRTSIDVIDATPAVERISGSPVEIVRMLGLREQDYLLLCSHRLRQERELLLLALPLGLRYIGVLGSRTRIARLFEGLDRTPNVHAPVGMAIGAEGPEEIAVSIAAELIAARTAMAETARERGEGDENRSDLSGGRLQPADGRSEATA